MKINNSNAVLGKFITDKFLPAMQTADEEKDLLIRTTGVDSADINLGSLTYEFDVDGWRYKSTESGTKSTTWTLKSKETVESGLLGRRKPEVEMKLEFKGKYKRVNNGFNDSRKGVKVSLSYKDRVSGQDYEISTKNWEWPFQQSYGLRGMKSPSQWLAYVSDVTSDPNSSAAVLHQALLAFENLETLTFTQPKIHEAVGELKL